MTSTLTRTFLPKQLAFLRATDPSVLYSGSVRAGKTYAGCTKAMLRACNRGAREAIVRKHLVTLTSTTLVTLLEGDGTNPPVLPPGTYEHNQSKKVIRIKGGGEIVYFGLDDPSKIGSYSLSGVFMDEAVEFNEQDFDMLQTRVSLDVPGVARQVYGACNPGPPTHFLARRFGLAGGHKALAGYRAFKTRSEENWFLPRDYLDRINALTGVARKRLVLGEWVGADGLVYDNWDRDVHVRVREGPWAQSLIGVDYGFSNPFAALLIGVDGDGRMHAIAEHYQSGMSPQAQVAAVHRLAAKVPGTERVVIDPSAAQLRDSIRQAGFATTGGENDIASGVFTVRQRLERAGDGVPRLTVDPTCENTIREFETYEYERAHDGAAKDKPKKESEHALDALRYAAMHLRGAGRQLVY